MTDPKSTYPTSELSRWGGRIVRATKEGPVQLTTNSHPVAVMVSQSDWDRIVRALNPPNSIEYLAEVADRVARGGE